MINIHLVHPEVNMIINKIGFMEKCVSLKGLMKIIESKTKELFPLLDEDGDELDEATLEQRMDDRNKFKGDVFEVFGEYFMKAFEKDKRVGIAQYAPSTTDDMGVDGVGLGMDEKPAVVQFKYRANIKDVLNYRTLATFGNDAFARFGITEDTTHNMVVMSTCLEIYYTVNKVNRDLRFIGYNHIRKLTSNNPQFWRGFSNALKISQVQPTPRSKRVLWDNQVEALSEIEKFLDSDEERGQIIMPTASGKTLVEHEAINESIKRGGMVQVVVAPKIALVQQIQREMWDYKSSEWTMLCICSGEREMLEFFEDEEWGENHTRPTTALPAIVEKIKEATEAGIPLVIFSTNHSVLKIGKALNELEISADLVVGDEAHNFTAENFRMALDVLELPTAKWLFFTATRKIDLSGKGYGMNNYERFGRVIYTLPPVDLIRAGRIVPPRLHIVQYTPEIVPEDHAPENIRNEAAMVIEGIKAHKKMMGDGPCRVIVFCDGAPDAHSFRNYEVLRNEFPEFYMGAVTSYDNLMDEQRHEFEGQNIRSSNLRKKIFDRFAGKKYAILFHYDIISEGIDLPGATGILPLRSLGEIKATQGIGRTLRLIQEDRDNIANGTIVPGDPTGWVKPYGWVILPRVIGKNCDDMERVEDIVMALRANDYDIDIETLAVIENPTGQQPPEPDFDGQDERELNDYDSMIDLDSLREICDSVIHRFEKANKALVRPKVYISKEDADTIVEAAFE